MTIENVCWVQPRRVGGDASEWHEEEHLRKHRGPGRAGADGDASRSAGPALPGSSSLKRARLQPRHPWL